MRQGLVIFMKFTTPNEIKKKVMYQKFYERGESLYRSGKVHKLRISGWKGEGEYRHLSITAMVQGEKRDYNVSMAYSEQYGLDSEMCGCAAYSSYPSLCKHCIAVQLALADMEVPTADDYNTTLLMSAMERSIRGELPAAGEAEQTLQADCKLSYDSFTQVWELSLRAGQGKLYVIKNLPEFFDAMEQQLPVSVGKGQTFIPELSQFDAASRQLLSFARECYLDNSAYAEKYYVRCPKGKLELMGGQLDALFDLLLSNAVALTGRIDGQPLEGVAAKNPDIRFLLRPEGEEAVFGLARHMLVIRSRSCFYIFHRGILYRTDRAFGELVGEVAEVLENTKTGFVRVSAEQQSRFNSLVVTPLSKLGLVEVSYQLQETFRSIPLEARVYLDYENGEITARTEYCYDDKIYTVTDSRNNPYRDVAGEYAIENLFGYFNFTMQKGNYILPDEEDFIYSFLESGLDRLGQLAQVYLSEAFKKINIRYPASISAGVRINGELLELDFDFGGYDPEELIAMLGAYRVKKRYFKLKNGTFINLEGDGLDAVDRMLDGLDISEEDILNGKASLPRYRALYLDLLSREAGGVQLERGPEFKQMIRDIRDAGDTDFPVPAEVKKILRPYQKTGYRWMKTLAHYNMCGILADDMGLGKTLQVITLLLSEQSAGKPSLIVVPTSLLYNWQSELKRFAPGLKVILSVGSIPERMETLREILACDAVVTSYELLKRDIDSYRGIDFRLCIIDEAQNIKNFNTQNAKAVKLIRAEHRFALTGTPIENSLSELWSIFDFLMPGYLGSYKRFKEKYELPIMKNGVEARSRELSQHIAPFVLRRLKTDVLKELPDKIETVSASDMTKAQREIYLAYLAQARKDIAIEVKQKGLEHSGIKILALLTRLRQICCHPGLFIEDYTGGSGKFELAMELIEDCIRSGHRILLFSQFTQMLGLFAERFRREKIPFFYLDGATKARERIDMVECFNNGEMDIFLISLKAGGSGLNLTGADVVIHYDPWWNPAVEDQATDRAYRIGQDKKVQVFKLISKDTIEERIQQLKAKKRGLIDTVMATEETFVNKLSVEELAALFDE